MIMFNAYNSLKKIKFEANEMTGNVNNVNLRKLA